MAYTKTQAEKIKEKYSDYEGNYFIAVDGQRVDVHHLQIDGESKDEYEVMVSCTVGEDSCNLDIVSFLALNNKTLDPKLLEA